MTEATTEEIWATTISTARFDAIGIRMAKLLNFEVNDDATSQVTNTAVTPVLEMMSEEILTDLIGGAKGTDVVDPWNFIQANFGDSYTKVVRRWFWQLKHVKKILGRNKTIEIVRSTL